MNDWRFSTTITPAGTTIYRGRLYRQDDSENWRWYWDGDGQVAFTVHYGVRRDIYATTDGEDTERAIAAYKWGLEHEALVNRRDTENGTYGALKRLAFRLTGNWDADFICVGLDRSTDLYALSWDGDPERAWRNEIEAVYHGDTWRIETEEYNSFTESWEPADDYCDEWHGYDVAQAAFAKEFPLDAMPAELLVSEAGA